MPRKNRRNSAPTRGLLRTLAKNKVFDFVPGAAEFTILQEDKLLL